MKSKKPVLAVLSVIAVLALAVAVLALLQNKTLSEKQQLRADAAFIITANGAEHKITLEEFLSLEQREVEANYKKNQKNPETRAYTGVPFAEILRLKGIDAAGMKSAVFTGADLYSSAISIEEALGDCWILYDGGGDGPFRMILPNAQFSQHWCKLLVEVVLQ
jgi:hypothetical protein